MASATLLQEIGPNSHNQPIGLFATLNLLTSREEGSPEDTKLIDSSFRNLGFQNLFTKNDFSIKDAHEAAETLINHPNKDLPRVLFIMSHGREGGQLEDLKERTFHINGIIERFNVVEHPELENTMKLIFVKACRGQEDPICYDSWNRYKNLAIGYSCQKNMKSARLSDGSPFIKVDYTTSLSEQSVSENLCRRHLCLKSLVQNPSMSERILSENFCPGKICPENFCP